MGKYVQLSPHKVLEKAGSGLAMGLQILHCSLFVSVAVFLFILCLCLRPCRHGVQPPCDVGGCRGASVAPQPRRQAGPRRWEVALSVLMSATPCPLVIGVPCCFLCAASKYAERAIHLRTAHALEALARADVFLFDKTGTLTTGSLELTSLSLSPPPPAVGPIAASADTDVDQGANPDADEAADPAAAAAAAAPAARSAGPE